MSVRSPDQAVVSSVSVTTSPVNIAELNYGRKCLLINNSSDQVLFLKFGTEPSLTSYTVKVPSESLYEFPSPCYVGLVTGCWAGADADGFAAITELM